MTDLDAVLALFKRAAEDLAAEPVDAEMQDAATPDAPIRATFERNPATKLTERLLVEYPSWVQQITPERGADGLMVGASFARLPKEAMPT